MIDTIPCNGWYIIMVDYVTMVDKPTPVGLERYKYFYETVELPYPGATEKLGEKRHFGHFFPQQINFLGLGLAFIKETDYNKSNPNELSANTLVYYNG